MKRYVMALAGAMMLSVAAQAAPVDRGLQGGPAQAGRSNGSACNCVGNSDSDVRRGSPIYQGYLPNASPETNPRYGGSRSHSRVPNTGGVGDPNNASGGTYGDRGSNPPDRR